MKSYIIILLLFLGTRAFANEPEPADLYNIQIEGLLPSPYKSFAVLAKKNPLLKTLEVLEVRRDGKLYRVPNIISSVIYDSPRLHTLSVKHDIGRDQYSPNNLYVSLCSGPKLRHEIGENDNKRIVWRPNAYILSLSAAGEFSYEIHPCFSY